MGSPLPSMAEENEIPKGAFVDNLPVDEDDYLQPRSTNPALYMDLIDGPSEYCAFVKLNVWSCCLL